MKSIVGALVLIPLMQAVALAQAPTADAKEGRLYLDGGISFGVATMAAPADSDTGFDSIPVFGAGLSAEYGITERFALFTKFGVSAGLSDDPGTLGIGMTFDGAYKVIERKGDVPALTVYGGLGFIHLDIDPDGPVKSDDETNFVAEFGVQADIPGGDDWSLQPFAQVQFVGGDRPFDGYNGVLQLSFGAKLMYKIADNLFLEPFVIFTGGNFTDSIIFGVAIQLQL